MAVVFSDEVRALIDGPNFAHLATVLADGAPHVAPVWIGREGDRILVATGNTTLKARNTRRDPRVGLSILDFDNPYREAQLRGRVVEHRSDTGFEVMDAISHKYIGKPFPFRDRAEERVALVIEVERARFVELPLAHAPPER